MKSPRQLLNIVFGVLFGITLLWAIIQSNRTVEGPLRVVMAVDGGKTGPEVTILNFNYLMTEKYAYQLIFSDKTEILQTNLPAETKGVRVPAPKALGSSVMLYSSYQYRAKGRVKPTKGSFEGRPVRILVLKKLELLSEKQ
ncbi:MAG: hypothetical protein KC684_05980 [Candidatus Omnitrophica bacterium]|nr:hypothetical protein [Candidatus Omnitrophota bacterium]